MNFQKYIKAVGTGPKSNRELTSEEMQDAITLILEQKVKPERITAFLLGWRVRLESNEELKESLNVCKQYITRIKDIPNSIELGYSYDGKNKLPYLFPLYSKYLKKADLDIVVSGDFLQPAKNGITIKDLCEKITLDENIHYFDRKEFCKPLSDLTQIRNILGLRTAFNTIEKLLNPAGSKYAITAAFHKPYVSKYHDIFAKEYDKLVIIKGSEGAPEIFKSCKYWLKNGDEIEEYIIDPEDYGIHYKKSFEHMTLEEAVYEVNNPCEDLENLARLNVAFLMFITNKAQSIEEAYTFLGEK